MLAEKYADRIEKIFAKYPDKRSGVMDLLYLAQEEYGWLSEDAVREVAELCDIDPTQTRSIAGFYTMYSEKPKGKYWLQVCTDLPCALRGADEFYQELVRTTWMSMTAERPRTVMFTVRAGHVPGRLRQSADAAVQFPLSRKP